MSVVATTVLTVSRLSLSDLVDACRRHGIAVRWVRLPHDLRGLYRHTARTIYLAHDMSDTLALPTLLHEMEHARRGDDGHQSRAVERRIDETVAHRLITAEEYARAEALTGGRGSGAIAAEMGLPKWVVSAYRRTLRRVR